MKRMLMFGTLLALLSPQVVNAQVKSSYPYKNNVKLNTLGLVFHNVSFIYERHLNEHWALLAGAGFRWGGDIPKVFGLGDLIVSSDTRGLRGYSFTPELRRYFKFCECGGAPSGLYAGFYTRYTRFYGNLNFHYWTGDEFIDVAVASQFNEIGAGIQLGYQFIFKERFTVDFMFAGPRLSSNRLGFSFSSEYAEELAPIIEEEINKRLEWLGKDPISISPSGEIETRFGFNYFRYAVAFGFMF